MSESPSDSRTVSFPVAHAQQFGRLVLHCALVGILTGLGAICFDLMASALGQLLLGSLAGFNPPRADGDHHILDIARAPEFRAWVLALLPAAGGLIGGALVLAFAPDAEGHGTDAAIDAYHNRQGRIQPRIPIIKTLASAITLGTGGSAGREGPIAQIGAGIGSVISNLLGLTARERRLLMVAGLAAGIGAVFRAPLAAALFSAELLYREMDMEFEVIVPSMISSIVSYSVFTMVMGTGALFVAPPFAFASPLELIPYTILAFAVAFGSRSYVRTFYFIHHWFQALHLPRLAKPVLGGVLAGLFAFFLPDALGQGYGIVQEAFSGKVAIGSLLALAVAKTLTTSFTVGSGQSGGVFGPAIVVGGALSGAVGLALVQLMPIISPPEGAFVLVGMAGFFAAAANAPISTIIMVSEITGNYRLLVPSMWVCVIAFMLVRRSGIYTSQLGRRSDSPVHLGEMMGEVLDKMLVSTAMGHDDCEPLVTLAADARLTDLREAFTDTHHACFPVVDADGQLLGVVDDQALRQAVCDDAIRDVLVAMDLIEPAPRLRPTETLHSAMHKMVTSGRDELVVVAGDDKSQLLGTLSRRDLIAAYDHQIRKDQDIRDQKQALHWSFIRKQGFRKKKSSPSPSVVGGGGGGAEGDGDEMQRPGSP